MRRLCALPLLGLVLGFLGGMRIEAYPPGYSPFRPGREPPLFRLQDCPRGSVVETASGPLRCFDLPGLGSLDILMPSEEGGFSATLRPSQGSAAPLVANVPGSPAGDVRVRLGRLNNDRTPDVVIETFACGCGLAAEIGYRTFLLSDGDRFVAVPVTFFSMQDADFTDIDHDGRPELIHTAFIYGEEGTDGRSHNYWVHNLLAFHKTRLDSANARHSAFPAWIQYKSRPNHRSTNQLAPGQRVRLWRSHEEKWFLGSDRLAAEQGR